MAILLRVADHLIHSSRWRQLLASATVVILLSACGFAQSSAKSRGPRALAGVELGDAKNQGAKLYPITILDRGIYFDARIYSVNPVPMAVEAGTVYEVQRSGEPVALVTIDQTVQQNGQWVAMGRWQPEGGQQKQLSKSGSGASAADDDRPVLKRAPSSVPPAAGVEAAPAPASSAAPPSSASPPADTDVNRPVLRRGRPKSSPPSEEVAPPETKAGSGLAASKPAATAAKLKPAPELLVAVSDAAPSDQHSYKFLWKPEEEQRLTGQMKTLAARVAAKYAQAHKLVFSGSEWDDAPVRAFDLFYDNDAEIVIAARRRARPLSGKSPQEIEMYCTVVALMNSSGELQQLFSDVTDDRHFDVAGRMELVDAVDADGDGRGELLFRRLGAGPPKFELYRVTRDQLYKLFESKE